MSLPRAPEFPADFRTACSLGRAPVSVAQTCQGVRDSEDTTISSQSATAGKSIQDPPSERSDRPCPWPVPTGQTPTGHLPRGRGQSCVAWGSVKQCPPPLVRGLHRLADPDANKVCAAVGALPRPPRAPRSPRHRSLARARHCRSRQRLAELCPSHL